jgi:signal transduction histidine kinase
VNNGYSYTPDEGHVNITLNADEDKIKVDVRDDGIGISDKDGRRIFERFFRGEDLMVLQTAGTGLGLAISKVLVEMHGGKIWFTSKGVHGEGSTFSFTLPVAKGED